MSSELIQQYQKAIDNGEIESDQAQLAALTVLQVVCDQLQVPVKTSWFDFGKKPLIKGAYLYGPVGRGKTFLMDLFFQALPRKDKLRMHFFQFMKMIHEDLKQLEGISNPLAVVAKKIAKKAKVICFDEFFVENVVDAMLLGGLLAALYREGVTLVATSNVKPDDLYKGGLQRSRFLPAIDLLDQNNTVVSIDNDVDYRLEKFDYDRAYCYPEDPDMQEMLFERFKKLTENKIQFSQSIELNARPVKTIYLASNAVWFDFVKLCGIPRSQLDYLTLSETFDAVFISGLRAINKRENDLVVNFISLVDVFYDAKVKLTIGASVAIDHIYLGGLHAFAFERTKSRLIEMQSKDYLNDH